MEGLNTQMDAAEFAKVNQEVIDFNRKLVADNKGCWF